MKNVLFISYFWPPSGKASLHWPLFIIKHLPKYNWLPSVLTVDEDSFSHTDSSLLTEVDANIVIKKTSANEPFNLYRKFLGKKADTPLIASESISLNNTDWKHKLSIWIRMNLFVPDARIGWYFSAVSGSRSIIESQKPEAIVSIGPPHSAHLIGKKLSKRHNIPHIPVLIDPWVDIIYYQNFKRNPFTIAMDTHFERSTLKHAKHVVFVTRSSMDEYVKKYPWLEKKSHVLYWGYNEEHFSNTVKAAPESDADVVLHAGNIFDYQNPPGLWKNIRREIDSGRNMRIRFVGTVGPGIKKAITEAGLETVTEYVGFLPYQQMVTEMMKANFLLVCATEKRHVPGKIFEYLRTGNRIIAFGDDNTEVEGLLTQTAAGILLPYHYDGMDLFQKLRTVTPKPDAAKQYSREIIARTLAALLDTLR